VLTKLCGEDVNIPNNFSAEGELLRIERVAAKA